MIYGEQTTTAHIDHEKIARQILKDIGYTNDFRIIKQISCQSPEIANAVKKQKFCANDQGIVFGYATNETKEYMPFSISIAHALMKRYEEFRKTNPLYYADAKSQVSIEYNDGKPVSINTILISVSHS